MQYARTESTKTLLVAIVKVLLSHLKVVSWPTTAFESVYKAHEEGIEIYTLFTPYTRLKELFITTIEQNNI
jgi:hypothetical protein